MILKFPGSLIAFVWAPLLLATTRADNYIEYSESASIDRPDLLGPLRDERALVISGSAVTYDALISEIQANCNAPSTALDDSSVGLTASSLGANESSTPHHYQTKNASGFQTDIFSCPPFDSIEVVSVEHATNDSSTMLVPLELKVCQPLIPNITTTTTTTHESNTANSSSAGYSNTARSKMACTAIQFDTRQDVNGSTTASSCEVDIFPSRASLPVAFNQSISVDTQSSSLPSKCQKCSLCSFFLTPADRTPESGATQALVLGTMVSCENVPAVAAILRNATSYSSNASTTDAVFNSYACTPLYYRPSNNAATNANMTTSGSSLSSEGARIALLLITALDAFVRLCF